jgi:hypothetical protein
MNYQGTKRRTRSDDDSPKPRTRRKDIPEDFDEDDIADGYDATDQERGSTLFPDNET